MLLEDPPQHRTVPPGNNKPQPHLSQVVLCRGTGPMIGWNQQTPLTCPGAVAGSHSRAPEPDGCFAIRREGIGCSRCYTSHAESLPGGLTYLFYDAPRDSRPADSAMCISAKTTACRQSAPQSLYQWSHQPISCYDTGGQVQFFAVAADLVGGPYFMYMPVNLVLLFCRSIATVEITQGTKAGFSPSLERRSILSLAQDGWHGTGCGPHPHLHCEDLNFASRPGPKSRNCSTRSAPHLWIMLFVLLLSHQLIPVAAVDARVGSQTHRRDPGAQHHAPSKTVEAKSGDFRHSDSRHNFPPRATPKKRALCRAIHRASKNEDHYTWYRGRRLHLHDLQAGEHTSRAAKGDDPPSAQHRGLRPPPDRPAPRLRIVCWNCGGLTSTLYQEVLLWLHEEEQAGRPVDVFSIVETSWREEFEFQTQPVAGSKSRWFAVRSGGKAKEGILCLIRSTLVPADCVRYRSLMDGRLLHVRLLLRVPLDIICTYQYAWNPQKSTLDPSHKVEQLVKQRARVWQLLSAWISQTPRRHGLVLLGDFNCPLVHDPPVCGPGLVPKAAHPHRDQADFQTLLHLANGRALNTWSAPGIAARTFLSPHADDTSLGTQIDYIIVRENLCDQGGQTRWTS